ncbi:hypothetical protein B0H14DRAFT_2652183 [Mycena olivaceomarginata]|nr:hypothetical protein B0H14DRAFT_2652183 [Mycena olivaceomarginata]
MIRIKSSQKSVTPPASEAYNEEGEEEKDEEEEEEEEEAPPRPAKRRRTAPALPKSKTPGKSKGKGKAQTRGKSKKAELPPYVPPQPVPLMDTVSLAAETLTSQRREPLVSFSPFSSTRDAPIASSATASVITVLRAPFASTARRDACPTAATTFRLLTTPVPPTILSRILGFRMSGSPSFFCLYPVAIAY